MAKIHDALLLVNLSLRCVARVQTSLNSCNKSQRENSVAAACLLQECTMSHEATCRSNMSRDVLQRRVVYLMP